LTRLLSRFICGFAIWPFIFVQPYFSRHRDLIEHGLVHFREQKKMLVIPWFLAYVLSKRFRRNAELCTYRHQIAIGGISVQRAAGNLTKYKLGISYRKALDLLR